MSEGWTLRKERDSLSPQNPREASSSSLRSMISKETRLAEYTHIRDGLRSKTHSSCPLACFVEFTISQRRLSSICSREPYGRFRTYSARGIDCWAVLPEGSETPSAVWLFRVVEGKFVIGESGMSPRI